MTPLMHAARSGNAECVALLVEAKANVNAKDEDGLRPLHFAAWDGNLEVAAALIDGGADPEVLDEDNRGPLDYLPTTSSTAVDVTAWNQLFELRTTGLPSSAKTAQSSSASKDDAAQ